MSLLAGTVQPPLLTLLSSTSKPPISPLWTIRTDRTRPRDSFITVLNDVDHPRASAAVAAGASSGSTAPPTESSSGRGRVDALLDVDDRVHVPKHVPQGNIAGPVIHIQSPTAGTTYLEAGTSRVRASVRGDSKRPVVGTRQIPLPLGVELPWLGAQIKTLGSRGLSVEIGLVDTRGREGAVRLSTWKNDPSIRTRRVPPLVHLPLQVPPESSTRLTPWFEIGLYLPPILALFRSLKERDDDDDDDDGSDSDSDGGDARRSRDKRPRPRHGRSGALPDLPDGHFSSVSYVRIYATCRVRRIWFSADGERTLGTVGQDVAREWALYAADVHA